MVRYLKYVFLIFALLALGVGTFFFLNNKHDVTTAFKVRDSLSYDTIKANCPNVSGQYYYPCFKEKLEDYMESVSITGISIGLKFAFNFMEEDKATTSLFSSAKVRDLHYSINYLEVNNMAIENSYKRYFGFEFAYPGYVSKLRDYFKNAYEFSENIIHGLRGKDGIASVEDAKAQEQLTERFEAAVSRFNQVKSESSIYVENEIKRILSSESSI